MSRTGSYSSALLFALGIGSSLSIGMGLAHADSETASPPTNSAARDSAAPHRSAPRQAAHPRTVTPVAARRVSTRSATTRIDAEVVPPSPPAAQPVDTVDPVQVTLAGVASLMGSAPVPRPATSRAAGTRAAVTTTATVPNVTVEAESLVLSPSRSGRTYSDTTASGGAALLISTNGTSSTTVTLPAFSSLVIRAKGDQYRGAPSMTVSVDGVVVSTASVSATSWTDYVVPVAGAAGTHTVSVAYTNELRASASRDRNLRVDKITVVAAAAPVTPSQPFPAADWLNTPIQANPVLAADSATWVGYFTAAGTQRVADLYEFAVGMVSGSAITAGTPRYDVTFTQPWGADPFGSLTVPIPRGTAIPPGSDAPLAVQDPVTGQVFGLWQAKYNSKTDTWTASWGGMTAAAGNGVDTSGSATATNISRYAGVVTGAELTAAIAANTGLKHALVFSTDIAGASFVGPATKSDGINAAGVALPIPEGYRVQLDPSINVDAIAGMTAGERVIAKTLQTYGAYVVDRGGARMAFNFELQPDATAGNPGKAYTDAGFGWDYFDMARIPWSSLRVLAA